MLFVPVVCCLFVSISAEDGPLVHSNLGSLRGTWQASADGKRYAAFTGVPFAKPPIGSLRFEPPEGVTPWIGTYDASKPTPKCMSIYRNQTHGQEDCLYLNVYTHNVAKEKLLPVLVLIPSGAFMFGGSQYYGGRYLMDRDVVLVTINYRVGPLGFLSLEDDVQPGNNGMRDQVAALKWVQDHVSAFGGDPDQVTLIGCSAGGASVHYHYLSPLSRGLFKRGISLSGTALTCWTLADQAREKALRLAASIGCPIDAGSAVIVDCLKQRRAEDILQHVAQFQEWQFNPFSPFALVVEEGKSQTLAPFLPDTPLRLITKGDMLKAPWVTGVTTHEGLYPAAFFIADEDELKFLDREFEHVVPHLLDFNLTVTLGRKDEVAARIRKKYFGDKSVDRTTVQQVIKMISDRLYVADSLWAAKLQAPHSPVYFYEFGFPSKYSLADNYIKTKEKFGTSHGDDVSYFINTGYIKDENRTGMAKRVETMMLDLWTNFAIDGVPKANEAPNWESVTPGSDLELLLIHTVPPVMTRDKELGDVDFWNSLPIVEEEQCLRQHYDKKEL